MRNITLFIMAVFSLCLAGCGSSDDSGSDAASISVTSPTGGGPFLPGQRVLVRWSSNKLAAEANLRLSLVEAAPPHAEIAILDPFVENDGEHEVSFPEFNDTERDYRFLISCDDDTAMGLSEVHGPARGFVETWDSGIDPQRWSVYLKKWGKGNNGCVPELVSLARDTVNGVEQNVVRLTGHGDEYFGPVKGVAKKHGKYVRLDAGTRVGACLVTNSEQASGRYEVVMKIGEPDEPPVSGMCVSTWTFHYEEHFAGNDPSLPNPADPLYRVADRQNWGQWVSVVNSEIDAPELGHYQRGDFIEGWYNTYLSDLDREATYTRWPLTDEGLDVRDGEYHTYAMEWRTKLTEQPHLTDQDVVAHLGAYYITKASDPNQGRAVVKMGDDDYRLCQGDHVDFYFDGQMVISISTTLSPVAARLIMGIWLPSWAGPAPWEKTSISIARVSYTPFNDPGDVLNQPETYPTDGLAPSPEGG